MAINTTTTHKSKFTNALTRISIALLSLSVLIGWAFFTTPSIQARVNVFWAHTQRFGFGLIDSSTLPIPTPSQPGQQVQEEFRELPSMRLEEAQKQVVFAIPQPQWLPDGIAFETAYVTPPSWVRLSYNAIDAARGFGVEISRENEGFLIVPESSTKTVLINGNPAIIVENGTWQPNGDWNETANLTTVSWSDGTLTYVLQATDISTTDVIKIAESLH